MTHFFLVTLGLSTNWHAQIKKVSLCKELVGIAPRTPPAQFVYIAVTATVVWVQYQHMCGRNAHTDNRVRFDTAANHDRRAAARKVRRQQRCLCRNVCTGCDMNNATRAVGKMVHCQRHFHCADPLPRAGKLRCFVFHVDQRVLNGPNRRNTDRRFDCRQKCLERPVGAVVCDEQLRQNPSTRHAKVPSPSPIIGALMTIVIECVIGLADHSSVSDTIEI